MARFCLATALVLLGEFFALQFPPVDSSSLPQTHLALKTKELVSSKSLQDRIHVDNLLERAKTLYNIAELGEKEYSHPTRVIGSKGLVLVALFCYRE
jgi:aminopeptidase Y